MKAQSLFQSQLTRLGAACVVLALSASARATAQATPAIDAPTFASYPSPDGMAKVLSTALIKLGVSSVTSAISNRVGGTTVTYSAHFSDLAGANVIKVACGYYVDPYLPPQQAKHFTCTVTTVDDGTIDGSDLPAFPLIDLFKAAEGNIGNVGFFITDYCRTRAC